MLEVREEVGWHGGCMAWPACPALVGFAKVKGAGRHGRARGTARALCVTIGETKLGQTLF
jgi:hypothetical protein